MTLFEVTVSLGLVAFAAVTVLAVLPQAVRTQERIRAGTLAASRVLEMAHTFTSTPFTNTGIDDGIPLRHGSQIRQPWNSVAWRLAQRQDIEHKLGSMTGGLCPIPPQIARRFDSDGDEIQRLLDDGGYVYYSNPNSPSQIPIIRRNPDNYTSTVEMPNEARRLVFGVVGYAQQDAIPRFPWRPALLHFPYPSPPHAPGDAATTAGTSDAMRVISSTLVNEAGGSDPSGFAAAFYASGGSYPGKPLPPLGSGLSAIDPRAVLRYYILARWNARKQLDRLVHPPTVREPATQSMCDNAYRKVLRGEELELADMITVLEQTASMRQTLNAVRYLAHAGMCLTRVYDKDALDAGILDGPYRFAATSPANLAEDAMLATEYEHASLAGVDDYADGNHPIPRTRVDLAMILATHQNCLKLAALYGASYPNDWGAPRLWNRAIMMDVPLLQWDVQSAPLVGPLFPTTANTQRQWLAMGSRDMRSADLGFGGAGLSRMGTTSTVNGGFYVGPDFRALTVAAGIWTPSPERFNLAKPFEPRERCRQIVVWSVDWQAYEDFETAPSAPFDSSRIPLDMQFRSQGDYLDPGVTSLVTRLANPLWKDWEHPSYRNPEKMLLFTRDVRALPSAQPVPVFGSTQRWGNSGTIVYPDQPVSGRSMVDAGRLITGAYGADRNGNRLLDRGPVPRSQRMRATLVARFNMYDPRVQTCFK